MWSSSRKDLKIEARMARDSDAILVARCLCQEREAQRQLFERYHSRMLGVCLRYAQSRQEAEDMTQEGFVRLFNKLSYFDSERNFEAWMTTLFVHNAIDYMRRHSRHQHFDQPENAPEIAAPAEALERLEADDLLNLLHALPDGYRLVFNMYAIEGFSHKDIAEKLGINEGTSKSQLAKARRWLKKKLEAIKAAES